jgi:hypothetical protein
VTRAYRFRRFFRTAVLCALALGPGGATSGDVTGAAPHPATARTTWPPADSAFLHLPSDLRDELAADPYAYFRFVNKAWAEHVCTVFQAHVPTLPKVRLHGDAHIEQYAFTSDAHGLDDFDDSAQGPSVLDLVRFIGSLDMAARQRGWSRDLDAVISSFFNGYYTALRDPILVLPEPAIVNRLRARRGTRTQGEFLAWADSLMRPESESTVARVRPSLALIAALVASIRPDLPADYLKVKKIGQLEMGIGSRLSRKLLLRVEGLSAADEDDVILEAKEASDLSGVYCLEPSRPGEELRVVTGAQQIGRLRHEVLLSVPPLPALRREGKQDGRQWWVRTWDRSYGEVDIADLESPADLRELARDVGVQLGSSNLGDRAPSLVLGLRRDEHRTVARLEPRIRSLAREMTRELIRQWEKWRTSQATSRQH